MSAGDALIDGEPVFAVPWEARAFAIAVALSRTGHFAWPVFAAALGREVRCGPPGAPYYECWLAALEQVLAGQALAAADEIAEKLATFDAPSYHKHDHPHVR